MLWCDESACLFCFSLFKPTQGLSHAHTKSWAWSLPNKVIFSHAYFSIYNKFRALEVGLHIVDTAHKFLWCVVFFSPAWLCGSVFFLRHLIRKIAKPWPCWDPKQNNLTYPISCTATFSFGGLHQAVKLVWSNYEVQLFARLWYMFWKSYASIGSIFLEMGRYARPRGGIFLKFLAPKGNRRSIKFYMTHSMSGCL